VDRVDDDDDSPLNHGSASLLSAAVRALGIVWQASAAEWALLSFVLFDPVLDDLLFWDVCSSGTLRSVAVAEAWVLLSDLAFFVYSWKDVAANLNHFKQPAQQSQFWR
jgi:hypothetical protein